jgi:hypothetical protein
VNRFRKYTPLVALTAVGALAGCHDFLTGGELSTDPNRPVPSQVSPLQLFVSSQSNLWSELNSDPARLAAMWTQQLRGANAQYSSIYNYNISESTTNGFHTALYGGGGLVDIRELEAKTKAAGDSLFYGIAQITEAALIGTGADLFGDIVYSNAFAGPNPEPDDQMAIYDALQVKLDSAIAMLAPKVAGTAGITNVGPGNSDLNYAGNAAKWTRLAWTLKARYYLHTAEVRGTSAYTAALNAASKGITNPADNYRGVFSGTPNQQNHYYQFVSVQRPGYLAANSNFVTFIGSDPRLNLYYNAARTSLSPALLAPGYDQPLITAQENLLIWAEAAYRTGNEPLALQKLNEERALWATQTIDPAVNASLPPITGVSGTALLVEILKEKYIALFGNFEAWNDYKRTCYPNITPPSTATGDVPARLYYDIGERQTDSALPPADQQPSRNANDPANATDPLGAACKGQ